MVEIIFLLFLHSLFFPIGLVLTECTLGTQKENILVCGILGYGSISVLATILYTFGISIPVLTLGFGLCSVGSIAFIVTYRRHCLAIKPSLLLLYMLGLACFISPALIGGGQFVIFQGNSYDHFNYLQAAMSYQDYDHKYLITAEV